MKRYIGYLLIIVGFLFVAMGLSSSSAVISNFIPSFGVPSIVTNVLGLIFIVVGVYFSWSSSSSGDVKHASSEVPIYEGEGKHKKIIGYKKVENK
ncbi:MAG: hypothetical protein AABW73_04890 [Nanoarchaeota archaeon]